jgi:hypothetical protein
MEKQLFKIPALARFCGLDEFPPVIEPALKDLKPVRLQNVALIDDEALEMVHEIQPYISRDIYQRIYEVADKNQEFKSLLGGKRHVIIGVSKQEQKGKLPTYLLVAYNYDDNHSIEITFTNDLEVEEVTRTGYQPAPTNEEIERAVQLARKDERIRAFISDDMVGGGILCSPINPGDLQYGNRLLDVRIGYSNERLAVCKALVNLATDTVISASCISFKQKTKEVNHGC